jgi:hypothetical protein
VDTVLEELGSVLSNPSELPLSPPHADWLPAAGQVGRVGAMTTPDPFLAGEWPEARGGSEWLQALGVLLALHGAARAGEKR